MKILQTQLLIDLEKMTVSHIQRAKTLLNLNETSLNYKTDKNSWSILECIEHLNRYGDFYIPEISSRIDKTKTSSKPIFKSGLLGNYFAKSMMPKEKLNVMKTFKSMNPKNSKLDKSVIEKFIFQQQNILELLTKAQSVDLNKIKTSISISNFIKLKLGDTFRVVIYHNERHIQQAEKQK